MFKKVLTSGVIFLLVMVVVSSLRAEERPQADFSVDVLSQYVWRGFALSDDSVVIEPSMTVSYYGFYLNLWGNYDTDRENDHDPTLDGADWDETDFTFGYTYDKLPFGLSLDLGTIYYALDGDDSFELYAGLAGSCPVTGLGLGVKVYREISHYPAWWIELSAGREFVLPWHGANLNLSLEAMYLDSEDSGAYPDPDDLDEFSGWLYLKLGGELNIPLGQYFTLTPKVYYNVSLSDDADGLLEGGSWDSKHDHFYGGIGLSFSF